jgi:hypothetical protein
MKERYLLIDYKTRQEYRIPSTIQIMQKPGRSDPGNMMKMIKHVKTN